MTRQGKKNKTKLDLTRPELKRPALTMARQRRKGGEARKNITQFVFNQSEAPLNSKKSWENMCFCCIFTSRHKNGDVP
jgi:hypothetical protein